MLVKLARSRVENGSQICYTEIVTGFPLGPVCASRRARIRTKEVTMAVITFSRQYGSGGREIAARVCDLLGYRYLDKRLIIKTALEAGMSTHEMLEFREESPGARNFIERLLTPGPPAAAEIAMRMPPDGGTEAMTLEMLDSEKCRALVRSVIHAEYQDGNAVIVGRGGQAVLQGLPGTLHVLVQASMPARILRIQQLEDVGMEQAYHSALDHDRITTRYLDRVFGVRWDDPMLYHMELNASKVGIEQAARIVAYAASVLSPVA
jgi:cytidylate kinase